MWDSLGVNPDGRYRVVPEEQIVRALLISWLYEARGGAEDWATRQVEQTLERWLAKGLPFRRQGAKRLFDFCQVCNYMGWAGRTHGDPAYVDWGLPTARRFVRELAPAAPTSGGPGTFDRARFHVHFRRDFNLRGIEAGRTLRLRVPLPFADRTQSEVSVEVVQPPPGEVRMTTSPGRLEVQLPGASLPEGASVEVHIRFTSYRESSAVDPDRLEAWDTSAPDYQLYTRRSEGLIQVTEPVARLSESLSHSARDAWQAVNAFWGFFFGHMQFGLVHYDELDPADPLASLVQRGWCDCYTGSALLAGLCRARGIPARIVSGLLLFPSHPGDHYWVEILLPPHGWVPLDLMSWSLAEGKADEAPWSRLYLGELDHRMKTQCLPRLVVGRPGMPLPPTWYMVPSFVREGSDVSMYSLQTREILYRDRIQVYLDPGLGEGGVPISPNVNAPLTS